MRSGGQRGGRDDNGFGVSIVFRMQNSDCVSIVVMLSLLAGYLGYVGPGIKR